MKKMANITACITGAVPVIRGGRMKQYCRYCAELKNGDALYCEAKEELLTESKIKRPNKCKCYAYCGFDENGFEHTIKERKPKKKTDNISLFMGSDTE